MRNMGGIKILLAALVLASIAGTGAASTGYFIVPLDQITNWPIDHLIYPPSGNITLGGVPFYVNREFQTQHSLLLDNPNRGVISVNVQSPSKIYILLNGAYVLKQFFEKEVGYIEMEFNDGSSFKKSIIAGRDLREHGLETKISILYHQSAVILTGRMCGLKISREVANLLQLSLIC